MDDRVGEALVPYDRAEARTIADRVAGPRAYPVVANISPRKPKVLDVKIRHTYPLVIGDLGAVVVAADEVTVPVGKRGVVIGRSSEADIQLPEDGLVSRLHAKLTYDGNVLSIQDLDSTNGTTLNGRFVTGKPLRVGSYSRLAVGTSGRSVLTLSYRG